MSTVAGSVVVAIKAVDEASTVFQKIQASMGILGSSLSELGGGFSGLGSVISGFAAGGVVGAAAAGLGQVIQGLQWSTEEAAKSEQAWKDLQAAVGATGPAWEAIKTQVGDMASTIQKTTVFSDEAVIGSIQRLTTFGMTYQQAMTAVGSAVDLAAAKHLDLQTATDLVGKAFTGNTAILPRYGINLDQIKESLGKGATDAQVYEAVLAKLNEQFGGTAAAQAETYAGTQERLKNAMSDLGEKIGGIMLPALASMTEGLIPVVDSLSSGVTAAQNWITEVSKMPEVKAAADAVGQAFQGLQTWLGNVGQTVMTELGPALTDLWDALKEIFAALQPLGEAFGEIWAAFTDGQGSGNALKDILWLIVQAIKDIAAVIRAVAPIIKAFAQGFKEAADFIAPAIRSMMDTIGEFVKWLHDTFDAFYNWLVGRSLWTDLWDSVVMIAGKAIGKLVSDLGTNLVKPMQDAFGQIQTAFDTGLKQLPNLVGGVISLIKGDTKKGMDELQSSVKTMFDSMPPIVQTAMTNVGSALQTGISGLQTTVLGFKQWLVGEPKWKDVFDGMEQITKEGGDNVQGQFGATMKQLKQTTEATLGATLNTLAQKVDQMSGQVTDLSTNLQNIGDNLLTKMNSMASTFMASITQSGQVAAAGGRQMTGDWQGSLTAMAALTVQAMQILVQTVRDAVGQIISEFRRGQSETSAGIHIPVYYDNAGGGGGRASPGGGGSSGGGSFVAAPSGGFLSQTTVPVTVNLDGRTIATAVEQRITNRIIPSERERRSFE